MVYPEVSQPLGYVRKVKKKYGGRMLTRGSWRLLGTSGKWPIWNTQWTLRCVIPVVLSNNNNKLMVHMYEYIVKNTTIFLTVRLLLIRYNYMFRPSMLAIFRLYMKHLTIDYIYTWVGGIYILWDGVGARSRFVFVEGVWIGSADPIHMPSTNTKRDLAPTPSHKM